MRTRVSPLSASASRVGFSLLSPQVMVQENRLETNYPHTECCGLAVADYVTVRYLDTFDSQTRATCCTPYHFCFCVELCGGVVATAPCDACNTCMFPCFRTYYPVRTQTRHTRHRHADVQCTCARRCVSSVG